MKLVKVRYKIKVLDMSFNRKEVLSKMTELGLNWVKHLEKIIEEPDNQAVNHWVGEMWGWFKDITRMTIKPKAKRIPWELFFEEFLTKWRFLRYDKFDFERFNLSLKEYFENDNLTSKLLLYCIKENIKGK